MTHRREQSFIYLKEKLKKHIAEEEEKNRPRTAEELLEAKAKELLNEAKEKEQKIFGDGETAFGKGLNANEVTPELLFDFEKLDKKKLKIPYYLQGNPAYYNQESLQAREKLKSSVRIRQVIQLFWDKYITYIFLLSYSHPKLPNGEMRRCVFPDFDKTKSKLSCLDDWDSMNNNEVSVDKDQYFDSIFEVADMWVDSIKEEEYIDFLHKMYSRVTMQSIASLPYSEKYGKKWMKRVEEKKKSRKPKELTPEEKHENTLKRVKKYKEEVDKDTPLICYVTKKKDLEALIVLVEEDKEDINQMNLLGQTPLMFASKCGKMKLIDYIYKKGGNINDQDVYFNTSLHYCALKKHRKAMTYLLKHGALRLANKKGIKPSIPRDLRILYGGNNLDEENENLGKMNNKKKKKVKLAKPEPQELSTACKMSNVEKVRDLLERGSDPNERDISGSTPFIHCAWRGHVVISQMLYEKGADINAQNLRKNTALHFAYERNNKALITYLESHGALRLPNALGQFPGGKRPTDVNPEDLAEKNNDSGGRRRSSIMDVNDPFIRANMRYIEMGLKPLSIATIQNDIETVKLLFKQKVDVNEVDNSGATALHYAAWYNRYTILRMLIAEGAEVNAVTNNGNTAMHFACERKNNDCVRYLEIKGAVLMKNDLGQYPGQRYEVDDHILLGEKKSNNNKKDKLDIDEIIKPNIPSTCETISWDSAIQKPSNNDNDNNSINEKQSNSTILHVDISKNEKNGFYSSNSDDDSDSDLDSDWSDSSDDEYGIRHVPTAPKVYDVTLTHLHDNPIFLETKMTRLQYSCSIGDLFSVKNLILEGDVIDYRSELGHTALMCASVNGHIEIVRFLVNSGCNQRLVNNCGYTALMLALYYEQYQVANYLGGSRRLEDMISHDEMRRIRLDAGVIIDKRNEKDIEMKRKRKSTFSCIEEIQTRFDEDLNVLENSKAVRSSITPISQRFTPHPPLTASNKAINSDRRSSIRNRRLRPQSAF